MKAVVMAGGEGSRLRPLTIGRPKPMVPLVDKPVLGHILELLKYHGITEVVITLQYLPSVIQDFYGDGSALGLDITYVVEEMPLGTAGGVKNAAGHLNDTFLVISGDALTDFNLQAAVQHHITAGVLATLAVYSVPNPLEYGAVVSDESGNITQFLEKPDWSAVRSDRVNTGIYVLEPAVLDYIPDDVAYDFSTELFPDLLQRGERLQAYVAEGYWCDVGTIGEYMRANADLISGKVWLPQPLGATAPAEAVEPSNPGEDGEGNASLFEGARQRGDLILGADVEIAADARIVGPVYLGNAVKIKEGVTIQGPCVVRDYTIVDRYSRLEHCVVWRNTYIGETCELLGAIICRQCSLKSGTIAYEDVVIGDNCVLDENCVVHPDVKLWPNKRIEPGAVVRESIIWGSRGRRSLFGRAGVSGVVNVDFTPEFAAKLGSSLGANLPRGSYVVINRDSHRSSRMLIRALMSGLSSAGVDVWDLGEAPVPVVRHFVRTNASAAAGVHVRLSPLDQRVVDFRFMDSQGLDQSRVAERSVERSFSREDFRRAFLDEVGQIDYPADPTAGYIESFVAGVDRDRVLATAPHVHPQIVVDTSHGLGGETMSKILNLLEVDYLPLNGPKLGALRDDSRPSVADQFRHQLQHMAKIMGVLDAGVGVKLDVDGERVFLIDERGVVLDDLTAALLLLELAMHANPGAQVALPAVLPRAFETVVDRYDGQIVFTQNDLRDLMRAADGDVLFATDGAGHFIFPDLQPVSDGLLATVRLLEYLGLRQAAVSEIVAGLPHFFMAHHRVDCPWEAKGTVMRLLNQSYQGDGVVTIDGLKIHFGAEEWVHIGPNPEQPLFEIRAEAADSERATALVKEHGDQLLQWIVASDR